MTDTVIIFILLTCFAGAAGLLYLMIKENERKE